MATDVEAQLRQLGAQFRSQVTHVHPDEILNEPFETVHGHLDENSDIDGSAERPAQLGNRDGQRLGRSLGVAAAVVVMVAGLLAALAWVDRGSPEPVASPTPTATSVPAATSAPAPGVVFGQFVWPAPAGGYGSPNELITAFTSEVLGWTAFDVVGVVDGRVEPQSFALANSDLDASIAVIATPSAGGWGFVQIGSADLSATIDGGAVVIEFETDASVVSSSVVVRLSGGTSLESTVTSGRVELAGVELDQLVSVLVVGFDADGNAVTANGGQYNLDSTVPSTTLATQAAPTTAGPLDYAPTNNALALWPYVNASDPAATTTGYGMGRCDSGYGTKILRLDPTTGASHAYAGTLCVFIELDEPRVDAITTCATTSDKFHYAICQRRTDRTEIDGPGTAITTLASTDQQTAMSAFPTATAWDQPEPFTVSISGTSLPDGGIAFDDGTVSVALTDVTDANEEIDPPGVCFTIGLSGASADGCVGRSLLATGLAYAAFQDGNGPIEIVGIVPDEVTSIQIEGTTLTPTNNVWHYTTTGSVNPRIAVQTADGRTATTS